MVDRSSPSGDGWQAVGTAVLEELPACLVVIDAQGWILWANAASRAALGMAGPAPVGCLAWDVLVQPDDASSCRAALLAALGGQETDGETCWWTPGGSRRFIHWRLRPLPAAEGRVLATGFDLTEAHRARARLRRIVESNMIGIAFSEPAGRVVEANDAFLAMIGRSREELEAGLLDWRVLTPPDMLALDDAALAELAAKGSCTPYEKAYLRSDGEPVPVLVGGALLDDGQAGTVSFVLDMRWRKRMEEHLTRSLAAAEDARRRSAFLAEAGIVLSSSLDYEATLAHLAGLAVPTIADWCIVDLLAADGLIRPLAIRHTEPEKQALMQQMQAEPPLIPGSVLQLADVLRTGRSVLLPTISAAELRAHARSAAHLAALRSLGLKSGMIVPLVLDGRVIGAISLGSSASGRQFGEQDLALAEELARRAAVAIGHAWLFRDAQQAIRSRQEVLAVVSHDLRNPLTTVSMAAGLIARLVSYDEGGALIQQQAETILTAANRMNRLIRDLLDLAAINAGRLSLELQAWSVRQILDEARQLLQAMAEDKGLQLEWRPAEPLPPLRGDRERILQVLSNLVGNAIKFTPAGGRVVVGAALADGMVVFSVCDTGPGIPCDEQPMIFERYWRAQATPARSTGLGLAISKGLVEAHGGRIWVDSTPGLGSTFSFTIPAASPEAAGGSAGGGARGDRQAADEEGEHEHGQTTGCEDVARRHPLGEDAGQAKGDGHHGHGHRHHQPHEATELVGRDGPLEMADHHHVEQADGPSGDGQGTHEVAHCRPKAHHQITGPQDQEGDRVKDGDAAFGLAVPADPKGGGGHAQRHTGLQQSEAGSPGAKDFLGEIGHVDEDGHREEVQHPEADQ